MLVDDNPSNKNRNTKIQNAVSKKPQMNPKNKGHEPTGNKHNKHTFERSALDIKWVKNLDKDVIDDRTH